MKRGLTEKQSVVFKWLRDDPNLSVFADAYKGAVILLADKSDGYITFVSHAGRDLMNILPVHLAGIKGWERVEYKQLIDNLEKIWDCELEKNENEFANENREGIMSGNVCKTIENIISKHRQGRKSSKEKMELYFLYLLDYDANEIPKNFYSDWKEAKQWFLKHTHLSKVQFEEGVDCEVEKHFKMLEDCLYAAASKQYTRLRRIDEILDEVNKSWTKLPNEIIREVLSCVKKVDRQYFFSRLKNSSLIKPLKEGKYFSSPPPIRELSDGSSVQLPYWPELRYLKNVADSNPDEVVAILLEIPPSDNSRVYEDIIDIALKIKGECSVKLQPKIFEYFETKYGILPGKRCSDLLIHWLQEDCIQEALSFVRDIIRFSPDPLESQKEKRRKEKSDAYDTSLEPKQKIFADEREYSRMLKGVVCLADKEPYEVALLLANEVSRMIEMTVHKDELNEREGHDWSRIWCRNLTHEKGDYEEPKQGIVHALTYACEKVYEKTSPDIVEKLDKTLRRNRWEVFKRLRQHLYALNVNEQTKPWIRDIVFPSECYGKRKYSFEFYRLIRSACEYFKDDLLTREEREMIFKKIVEGPPKNDQLGDYNENKFLEYQEHFHHLQLAPFASVLFGKYKKRLQELDSKSTKPIADEDYIRPGVRSGAVSYKSPLPQETLVSLPDEELLQRLNNLQYKDTEREEPFVIVGIRGLADEFQLLFQNVILQDSVRFQFWVDACRKIKRPIYVRSMIQAFQAQLKEGNLTNIGNCFQICEWIMSHPSQKEKSGFAFSDESGESVNWVLPRRAVSDFIGDCLKKENNVPITERESIAKLLDMLCTQHDWRLDTGHKVLVDGNNQFAEAINNTRSSSLENLVNFGYWVRRNLEGGDEVKVCEVVDILEKRMSPECDYHLTLPEYAIIGANYLRIYGLDKQWATQHKEFFFPRYEPLKWVEAFRFFLYYTSPYEPIFQLFKEDIQFALDGIDEFQLEKEFHGNDVIDNLGQHLFHYYLWGLDNLADDISLLRRYYHLTKGKKHYWAGLFNHVGHLLKNSKEQDIDGELKERIIQFFNWRFDSENSDELQEFVFWMKSECFPAKWKLESLLKIAGVVKSFRDYQFSTFTESLCTMLENNPALVVECFSALTSKMDDTYYVRQEEAKLIIQSGLKSEDINVQEHAENARENLLKRGYFEFVKIENPT